MSGYIVRLIDGKEIVGVYMSKSVGFLASMVDEVTDPSSCEYLPFVNGGLIWPLPGAVSLARFDKYDENGAFDDFSLGTPEVDSLLGAALHDCGEDWKPFFPEEV